MINAIFLSEDRLRFALDASGIGEWGLNIETGETWHSVQHQKIFGVQDNVSWSYDVFLQHVYEADRVRVDRDIKQAIASKSSFDIEHRIINQGNQRWVSMKGAFCPGHDGSPDILIGTVQDITESKQSIINVAITTAELERQKLIYDAALSNIPDFVYVISPDNRFIYANDALIKVWGRTREESIGRNWIELGYDEARAKQHSSEIQQVIETKNSIQGEVYFSGTNGRRLYNYIFFTDLRSRQ